MESNESIESTINSNSIAILKFDNEDSKYNEFFDKLKEINFTNITNITDKEIIDFYDIDVLPTIYVYRNKNLMGIIEGFHLKTTLLKKINNLII